MNMELSREFALLETPLGCASNLRAVAINFLMPPNSATSTSLALKICDFDRVGSSGQVFQREVF